MHCELSVSGPVCLLIYMISCCTYIPLYYLSIVLAKGSLCDFHLLQIKSVLWALWVNVVDST